MSNKYLAWKQKHKFWKEIVTTLSGASTQTYNYSENVVLVLNITWDPLVPKKNCSLVL